jgi:hypothetical protein
VRERNNSALVQVSTHFFVPLVSFAPLFFLWRGSVGRGGWGMRPWMEDSRRVALNIIKKKTQTNEETSINITIGSADTSF